MPGGAPAFGNVWCTQTLTHHLLVFLVSMSRQVVSSDPITGAASTVGCKAWYVGLQMLTACPELLP
jgi:hypothetical protein